jgi:hypothetical protein
MALVTLALVLVPCLIAGGESAQAGGEREWQAATSAAQGANNTQTAAGELVRMASELQKVVAQFKYDDSATGSGTADFRSMAKQTHDAHLASRAKTQPDATARVH